MCFASSAMDTAQNKQATSANTTDSGSEPPANAAPAGIEAAMAAPGAMSVMLWNSTSRSPIASLRSAGAGAVASAIMTSGGSDHATDGCDGTLLIINWEAVLPGGYRDRVTPAFEHRIRVRYGE